MRIKTKLIRLFPVKHNYEKYPTINYYRLVGWYNFQFYFRSFGFSLSIKAKVNQ